MILKPRKESITTQKEILKTTQGLIFKVGGITLDGTKFTAGIVPAGTPVTVADGAKAVPFVAPADGAALEGTPYVTTHDVKVESGADTVVGAFEEAYFDKNKVELPEAFITAAGGRYKLR